MISDIRQQLKNPVFKTILWVTVISVCGGFSVIPALLRNVWSSGGPWAIKVNGFEISRTEFMREISDKKDLLTRLRAQYGQYADALLYSMGLSPDPRALAFESMIREEVIDQSAHAVGLHISPDFINEKLHDPSFVARDLGALVPPYVYDQDGSINPRLLRDVLAKQGLPTHLFERKIERVLAQRIMLELLMLCSYVPDFVVQQRYMATVPARRFSILTFPLEQCIQHEQEQTITQQELQEFFDVQNKQLKRYWTPEKRAGVMWTFSPASFATSVSEEKVRSFYEENKSKLYVNEPTKVQVRIIALSYNDELSKFTARAQIEQAHAQVTQEPEKFAQVAREISQNEFASDGGLMPFFARGEHDKVMERAAFLLAHDGDISAIIEGANTFFILKREAKKLQVYKPFESVREEISAQLTNHAFKQEFLDEMKRMTQAAQELDEQAIHSMMIQKGGVAAIITAQPKDSSKHMVELFRLSQGNVGFYAEQGEGVALMLTRVEERYLPSLEAIVDTVRNDLVMYRAERAHKKAVEEARQDARILPVTEIAARYNAQLMRTDLISKDSSDALKELNEKGITQDLLFQLEKVGSMATAVHDATGVLVRLDDIETLVQGASDSQKTTVRAELDNERSRALVDGFVASLYRNATIETNDSMAPSNEDYSI